MLDIPSIIFVGDLKEIEDALQKPWLQMPLSQLCTRENEHLKDLLFNLPDDVQNELERMCIAFSCRIFCKIWKSKAVAIGEIDISDIVGSLFHPVLRKVSKTTRSLLDQTITLKKVTNFFEEFIAEETPDTIQGELDIIICLLSKEETHLLHSDNSKIMKTVVKKVFDFFKLQKNRKKAANIIELGKSLKLKGDFERFEKIGNKVHNFHF